MKEEPEALEGIHAAESDRAVKLLFIGVLLLAVLLRIWGIDFGLPQLYHPDEPLNVRLAQGIIKTGSLKLPWYGYPPVSYYIQAPAYALYYLVGKATGTFQSVDDLAEPVMLAMGVGKTEIPGLFVLGRSLSVLFSVGSVLLVFFIGYRLTRNRWAGLLASLLMAVSPGNVASSRFITPDAYVIFFVLLCFWGAVLVYVEGKTWHYLFAGVAAGVAAASKYNGVVVIVSLFAAHLLRHGLGGLRDWRFYAALSLCPAVFLILTPYAVLDYQQFISTAMLGPSIYAQGQLGQEGNSLSWYITYLLSNEGPVTLLALAGLIVGLVDRSRQTVLLAVFPLAYFLAISSFVVRNVRTIAPLTPFLFLLGSLLLVKLCAHIAARKDGPDWLRRSAAALALLAVIAVPLVRTVKDDIRVSSLDSRVTAGAWIMNNLPKGSRLAIEAYTPFIDPRQFIVKGFPTVILNLPGWYVSEGFEYLVLGEHMFGRFFNDPARYPEHIGVYEDFFRRFYLVKTFNDGGYEVRIYAVIENINKERGPMKDRIGVFREGSWYLDDNGDGVWSGCATEKCYSFGLPADTPVTGNWTGKSGKKVGVRRGDNWYLDYHGNGVFDGCGKTRDKDRCYTFGESTDIPVVGDWNGDGITEVGVYRSGRWHLDYNGNGSSDGCGTTPDKDRCYTFGESTDIPVVGDWNGDGITEIGVYRSGRWHLDYNGNGVFDGCGTTPDKDRCYTFGESTDTPVVGDWNGDSADEIGLFANRQWSLDFNGDGVWEGCTLDRCYTFGKASDRPFAGRW